LRSLALTTVHSMRRGYPPEHGAHIVLRTIRRFLEKQSGHVDRVVLVLAPGAEADAYEAVAPLYFPRSEAEQHWARPRLPADLGDANGEPVVEERRIPIAATPLGRARDDDDDDGSGGTGSGRGGGGGGGLDAGGSPRRSEAAELEEALAASPFAAVVGDHDAVRRRPRLAGFVARLFHTALTALGAPGAQGRRDLLRRRTPEEEAEAENARQYARWLQRARTEDLAAVAGLGMLYRAGLDQLGRPVVVFVGRHFPARAVDLNKVLCHCIQQMDAVVNKDYVVVYLHTLTTSDNHVDMGFLKTLYKTVDNRSVLWGFFFLRCVCVCAGPGHGGGWAR
jgi:hypothetical protein